jgi:hypothetical protein
MNDYVVASGIALPIAGDPTRPPGDRAAVILLRVNEYLTNGHTNL